MGHDNSEGEHDLREVVKTAVPLSAPERFAGFPTMNYHVDVEICMTGECGVPCETLAEGRTALGRSIFPDIDLPGLAIDVNGIRVTKKPVKHVTGMETKKWLQDNNLPITTDIEKMYAYLDREIEQIRQINKRNGKKLRRINNKKLVNQWVELQQVMNTGRIRRSLPSPGVGGVGNFVFEKREKPTIVKNDKTGEILSFQQEITGQGEYKIDRNSNRRVLSSSQLVLSESYGVGDIGEIEMPAVLTGDDEEHSVLRTVPDIRPKFAGSDLTRNAFELGEEEEKVESWANEILYILIGVAGFLMIVFLALLIHNQRVAKISF